MKYPVLKASEVPKGEVQVRSPIGHLHGEEEHRRPTKLGKVDVGRHGFTGT